MSTVAIVALVIVAIIAALILIILLTPITYSIEVDGRSPYRGEVRVKWLWRVFSLHLAYLQDKPFFKELYILGMLKIGPVKDYEEWLENRVDEEYQKVVDEDDEMSQTEAFAKAMQGGGQGPSASSSGTSFEDLKSSQRSDITFDDEESPGAGRSENPNERIERPEQVSKDMDAQARADRYDSIQQDPTSHIKSDDETVSRVTFNSDGSIKEKVFTKVKDLKTTVKHRFEKPDPNDPVASFKSKIPTFWFMKHVQNTELWHQLFLVSKRCYDHSKPRDVAIEGRFGVGDPYSMGIIASMLYSIWPEQAENIELDYINWVGEGSGHIKGRIILAVMAWHGTRFLLSKPMRSLLGESARVFWVKRKEAKQLEKLKAEQGQTT
ncbi:MAG: hypothetical protein KH261_03040 [Veillonella sp.]|uniref:hypothetical protein n=1 Tax=Veillonella sp. TaxID=1926307 RepID=UPI0025FAF0FD|nr:hypothetical protein [Veillonella sp.]MBS6659728.1 hypothetical protein [Veillonella sp.]